MKKIITTILLIGTFATAYASIDQNLKYGQRSTEVFELQDFLVDQGLLSYSTGYFGVLTLKAVKMYQANNNIPATGYVGTLTRKSINDALAIDTASSTAAEIAETGTTTQPTAPTPQVIYLPVYQTVYVPQPTPQSDPQPTQPQAPVVSVPEIVPDNTPVYRFPDNYVPELTLSGARSTTSVTFSWSVTGYREQFRCTIGGESVVESGSKTFVSGDPITLSISCQGTKSGSRVEKSLTVN